MDHKTSHDDVVFFRRNKNILKWLAIIGVVVTIALFSFFIYIDLFNRPELLQKQLERRAYWRRVFIS